MTTHQESDEPRIDLTIDGCSNATVIRYFETLNAGDFDQTAALFAEDGALIPPFEEPIVGPAAIATYLHNEAVGMRLHPQTGTSTVLNTGNIRIDIKGKVKTLVFGVNVGWAFVLTAEDTIKSVQVKLIASPQELLKLMR